jgi:IS30 family transposase
MLIQVPSKDTEVVVAALSQQVRKLPATLRRSLAWDRGLEMAKHKAFTVATDVKVYFCDPQSPWQRGTNENTNLLLRQYFLTVCSDITITFSKGTLQKYLAQTLIAPAPCLQSQHLPFTQRDVEL